MCKNMVEPDRPQTAIRHMHFACWITNVINTPLEYVIILVFQGSNGCTNAPQLYVIEPACPVRSYKCRTGRQHECQRRLRRNPAGHHHNVTKMGRPSRI